MESDQQYDVIVVGGGAAGLNGALMLARSRRAVLVVDAGEPRNARAGSVHGLLGHDGVPPAELLATGRAEVERYGGEVLSGEVVSLAGTAGDLRVGLADGRTARARRLLLTTGLVDELPGVDGVAERWGRDVVHCPYCHGWEVHDQTIAVLGAGPMSAHQALMFRQLSDDVVYLGNATPLGAEAAGELTARGIRVVDQEVVALVTEDDRLTGVRLRDGTVVPCGALAVSPRSAPRGDLLAGLGLRTQEHPSGLGAHLPVDAGGRTELDGVWAAGNLVDLSAQVSSAAASGAWAGAQINADLVGEDTRAAVARR